jgi:transcriptional regulator with XRE-family HTH domain
MNYDVARIIYERTRKGWLQGDLAKAIRVSQSMVSKIETGDAKGSPRMMKKIARVLGLSMDDIIVT